MRVQDLINILSRVENKDKPVGYIVGFSGEFIPLDTLIGVGEYADCVVLQHEVKVIRKEK